MIKTCIFVVFDSTPYGEGGVFFLLIVGGEGVGLVVVGGAR